MSLPIKGPVLMGPVSCVVKGWACVAKGEGTDVCTDCDGKG